MAQEIKNKKEQEEEPQSRHSIEKLTTFGRDGKDVFSNNDMQVIDLEIKDRFGIVKKTIRRVILYPTAVTEGERYENVHRDFHFQKGAGLIIRHTEQYAKIGDIEPESYTYIEKNEWHQIVNTSPNEDMEYEIHHPGKLDLPPESRRMNVNGKKKK